MSLPLAPSSRWQACLCGTAYGVRLALRADRREALEWLHDCVPPGWRPGPAPLVDRLYSWCVAGEPRRPGEQPCHRLYADRRRLVRTACREELLAHLESDLQLFVAERSPGFVFVHAGAVGWKGRALLLPGRSYSGKSTLVAALLRAGATYYSDEYAVLDAQGRVHPYPRRLSLRQPAGRPPMRCPPEALGACAGVAPLPVGLVALTRYRPGGRWRPQPVSPGEAVLALVRHTVPIRRRPDAVLDALRQVVTRHCVVRGPRGEADETAQDLLREVGG
jgi:hypothetical protein